jgi:predicted TIM-barrel fold metal-dependent hydrolase
MCDRKNGNACAPVKRESTVHRMRVKPTICTTIVALVFLGACRRQPSPSRPDASTVVARASTTPAPSSNPDRWRRASFPVIDVHTHIEAEATQRALAMFDARNIRIAFNLSGGAPGQGLEESLEQQRISGQRIRPFCNIDWRGVGAPDWLSSQIHVLEQCAALGVKGWKIPKVLGLAAGDGRGNRLHVDDPMLDPLFERAGSLGLVVLIHSGDPRAFFEAATPLNERWDELQAHPAWSFADPRFPRWTEILGEFETRVLRHPRTRFIGAHFGNAAEDPDRVERLLERASNYYIDTSARVPEFGRHDVARMRRFFVRWQDRILFGTDLGVGPDARDLMLGSTGTEPPGPADIERFWTATFRYYESNDRGFAHPTAIQGRWTIDAVGLPEDVLRKVYGGNAARLFGLTLQ